LNVNPRKPGFDCGAADLNNTRDYFHFLGKTTWRIKNFKGAKKVVLSVPCEKLAVLGGNRIEWNRRFKITLSPRVKFYGMVGGREKLRLINGSKGLIHPIKAHESFGLALIESLYFGCPVFGTPYGSLPEIITKDFGFLSNKSYELSQAIKNAGSYCRKLCHEYARDCFNSRKMALNYLQKYEQVINGQKLNPAPPRLKEKYAGFLPWE
jgi:glycosyltransferase involved in cell wall biosynthesis